MLQLDVGFSPADVDIVVNPSGAPVCSPGSVVNTATQDFITFKLLNTPGVRVLVVPKNIGAQPYPTFGADGQFGRCNFRVNNFPADRAPWLLNANIAAAGNSTAASLHTVGTGGQISCCGC